MSIHKSKGLEYKTVYLISIGKQFPSKTADYREEGNLFYVACTRAKENLHISTVEEIPEFVNVTFNDILNNYKRRDKFMIYMGSKNRLSKELVPIIQKYIDNMDNCKGFLVPFCGGANIEDKIMNELTILDERVVLEKEFKVYGTKENPLFLAKDVAEWIEHSNITKMLNSIDEDEKIKIRPNQKLGLLTPNNEYNILTEDGLYEVLMQSRKPIAKEFKKNML